MITKNYIIPSVQTYKSIIQALFFLAIVTGLISCRFTSQKSFKESNHAPYRVVILTDMTHDDGNSFIRYLYYTPHFDTEAIVVTPQLPDYYHDDDAPWEKAQTILQAYKEEYDGLNEHDSRFPTYEELSEVTKRGRGALPIIWLTKEREFAGQIADRYVESSWGEIQFEDWIGKGKNPNGESKDSEGSEFLQQVFEKDDTRPIFVQMWGGPITFMQALYRYEQRHGSEKFQELLNKLHVYSIHLQDITFDYMIDLDEVKAMDCLNMGETRSTYEGERINPKWFLVDEGHFWRYLEAVDPEQVNGYGPLSDLYDGGGEGDTPSFLYLISAVKGLNDPLDPTQGSWGNMFYSMGEPFPENYYHTCPGDNSELNRWIDDATNSFMARLQWSVKVPSEVNRAPVAFINGNESNKVLYKSVRPGNTVHLDASQSHDPDGDVIHLRWFHYREAGTYGGDIPLDQPESAIQLIDIPEDIGDDDIHLVLEVRDTGSPQLVTYRRIIVNGN